jgi:hypothetical protein
MQDIVAIQVLSFEKPDVKQLAAVERLLIHLLYNVDGCLGQVVYDCRYELPEMLLPVTICY